DPKTPLRYAMVRVCLTAVLGILFAFPLRPAIIALIHLLHLPVPVLADGDLPFGAIGLTASAGMAGWVEFVMLRRALTRKIGEVKLDRGYLVRLWISALIGSAAGVALDYVVGPHMHGLPFPHILEAIVVAGVFG